MVTYAIGDVQGCDATLGHLLQRLPFDDARDALWFTGDLVNRGPRSLATLRRLVALSERLGERCVAVLGNHDLHLLAVAAGIEALHRSDTLDEILAAPDRDELLDWLRHRPLLHRARIGRPAPAARAARGATLTASVAAAEHVLVHAGLHPRWSVDLAHRLAGEAQAALRGSRGKRALKAITGRKSGTWDDTLTGDARLATIVAVLTRVRTCRADGRMCREAKGPPAEAPHGCTPWYAQPDRASRDATIVFGHWAALGLHRDDGVLGLDTGCVWGGPLTALRLEDGALFQQPNAEAG